MSVQPRICSLILFEIIERWLNMSNLSTTETWPLLSQYARGKLLLGFILHPTFSSWIGCGLIAVPDKLALDWVVNSSTSSANISFACSGMTTGELAAFCFNLTIPHNPVI